MNSTETLKLNGVLLYYVETVYNVMHYSQHATKIMLFE